MAKDKADKVELLRDWYSLAEAAAMADKQPDDLLHMAKRGELQICVIAGGWSASRVYEIDHSIDVERDGFSISYRGPDAPEFPTGDDESFADKVIEWQHGQERQDAVVHNLVSYGRRGQNGWWYDMNPKGPAVVAASSIAEYLVKPDTAHIEIDINTWKNIADPVHQRFFRPDPEVLVKDALQTDRLVLLKADLERLRGGGAGAAEEKPDKAPLRNTLLKIIYGMAISSYSHEPKASKNPAVKKIAIDLELVKDADVRVGDDTIRKVLDEASELAVKLGPPEP